MQRTLSLENVSTDILLQVCVGSSFFRTQQSLTYGMPARENVSSLLAALLMRSSKSKSSPALWIVDTVSHQLNLLLYHARLEVKMKVLCVCVYVQRRILPFMRESLWGKSVKRWLERQWLHVLMFCCCVKAASPLAMEYCLPIRVRRMRRKAIMKVSQKLYLTDVWQHFLRHNPNKTTNADSLSCLVNEITWSCASILRLWCSDVLSIWFNREPC